MLLMSTIMFASAPPASAVPTPTRSQANNNAPMGFFASDGDAPNPASFCESPDYFDEWNVNPAATSQDGPWTIDTGAGQFGGGVTATLTENSEPVLQGQAKWGIRFGGGAQGTVTLSEPIFYSQWIASDMDINGEGFEATATYNGLAAPVTATAAFGANTGHTVTTTQPNMATIVKNTNGGTQPWTLTGRSQVDFLGPVDEVFWNKTGASGWIAGFMPAMGCAAFGSAKEVSSPAVWNATTQTFSTQYTIQVRSNMPNGATINAVLANAAATLPAFDLPPGLPEIPIMGLEVTDSLVIAGSTIQSVSTSSTTAIATNLNPAYNGDGNTDLILPYNLAPETTEVIIIDVEYAPDFSDPVWADRCHQWTNQSTATGIAATAIVNDISDNGNDPRAAETGGDASTETPTPNEVCVEPEIDITKTLNGTPVLNSDGTIDVTYDLLVDNIGDVDLTNVSVTDDLGATFGAGSSFSNIVTSATGPCAGETNPNFNGTGNPELLNGGVTIPAAGANSCTISVSFRVDPGDPVVLSPGTTYPNTADTTSMVGTLPAVAATDDETFTQLLPAEPSWELQKATVSEPAEPGDTLDYTFTLTNTGNTTVSDIIIVDDKCAAAPALTSETLTADTVLELTETQVWECTSVPVTAEEVDAGSVDNNAEATGTPEQGTIDPAPSAISTPILPDPDITVVKANLTMPTAAGDTIDYSFSVENTGNVSISDIVVTDAKCAAAPTLSSESVTANTVLEFEEVQVWECTSIPVTQAEADAGVVNNSVEVTGAPAGGVLDPAADTHVTPIVANPAWSLVKGATTIPGAAGDTVEYSFTLVNTGNVTISDVVLVDAKCAAGPALISESINANGLLDVGETQIWGCTSVPVTQAEVDAGVVDNEVEATGTPAGGVLEPAESTHQVGIDADPSWDVVKAAATTPSKPGDTINYTFTVINTGNVTISGVALSDAKCATPFVVDSESLTVNGVLDAGESQVWSCTSVPVTQGEADAGQVDNSVEVTGTPAGGTLPPAMADHTVPLEPAPAWVAGKTSTTVPTEAGDTIDYTFTILNTGNVSVSAITLVDPKCASGPVLESESVTTNNILDFEETQVWSCTSIPVTQAEVDAGQVDNEVQATGTPAGGVLPPADAEHTVPVVPAPSWDVVKANTSVPTEDGDTIEYSFTVVNTGNVTISGVTLSDAKCATAVVLESESITANTLLDAGETQVWSCTSIPVTQAEVDAGVVNNNVEVAGVPAGGVLPPAADDHSTPIAAAPSWDVVKAAATVPSVPGDTIDYTFSVVNTGNVTIGGVALSDAKCATAFVLESESATANAVLDAGETQVWSCTSVPVTAAEVNAGAVNNSVEVTGTPAGGTLPPATDDHVTPVTPAPSWAVVKSTSSAPTEAGQTVDYVFTVINTGNVSISGVVVADDKCDGAPVLATESVDANGELDYDETQVWRCTSIAVTQAEVDAGVVSNAVEVTGTPAGGTLGPAEDTHDLPIDPMPAWEIVKASSSEVTVQQARLDYTFTLINTGNVTISGIVLQDVKCDGGPVLDSESITTNGVLDAGETQIWSCTSNPVLQSEIDEGGVNNEVTATGMPAGGTLPPATDEHEVPVDPQPRFQVVKATSSVPRFEGDVLVYTFTVVNTGNVTIGSVQVLDLKCATAPVIDSESISANNVLEFGETQVWSCTSVPVTQAEVDAGVVSNDVEVQGTPANGVLEPAVDDLETPITAAPSWAVVKDTPSAPTQVGETLVYTFRVINTGNVTIGAVAVVDDKCVTAPALENESVAANIQLDFGETQTWSCTSVPVTQVEVDAGAILNNVQVTGTPAGGELPPAEAMLTTPVNPQPRFEVVKANTTVPGMAGETIDYTFTVVNTGNVTIRDVMIGDVKCATTPVLDSESLNPDIDLEFGETQVWSCTSVPVTQTEVDAGVALNTVTVSGSPAGGTLEPAIDEHAVSISAVPSFEVIKASATSPSLPGDTIAYTFTVVNNGNVTINSVVVADAKCAAPATLDFETITPDAVLAVGETQIWSCTSLPVTAEEIDAGIVENTVSVTGDPSGGELDPATDDHDIAVTPLPGWIVGKTALNGATAAGDTVDYEFAVINTGNVSISEIVLADAKCASDIVLASESGLQNQALDFAETQVWSCTSVPVTQAEADAGRVENTVDVNGSPAGGELPTAEGQNTVPIVANPQWEIVKSSPSVPGKEGELIEYSFTLVNTGNVSIANITLEDAKCLAAPMLVSETMTSDATLEPGETQLWACTSIPITQAEIDSGEVLNSVTGSGLPSSGSLAPATDDHVIGVTANPVWSVVKSSPNASASAAGETLAYGFTVVNSGNVSISDVSIYDAKCATTPTLTFESLIADGDLQFGETQIWECTSITVTQDEVDAGVVENSVQVTGTPAGGELPPAEGAHTVNVLQVPDWTATKASNSPAPQSVGDTLTYDFVLTNTGNVTIVDVVLVDGKCATAPALLRGDTDGDGALDVDEAWEYRCVSIGVTQAELDAGVVLNEASASGSAPGGLPAPSITAQSSISTDARAVVPAPTILAFEVPTAPVTAPAAPDPEPVASIPAPILAITGLESVRLTVFALMAVGFGFCMTGLSRVNRRRRER